MMLTLPTTRYPDADSQALFYDRIRSRLATIPGVESVTVAGTVPAGGTRSVPYELAGAAPVAAESRPTVALVTISPGYFRTLGATVLAGREFNDFDGRSSPVAIVNEQFARMHWPGQDARGKRLRLFDEARGLSPSSRGAPDAWVTVVGVVSNILLDVARKTADPVVYVPYQQWPLKDMWVLARTAIPLGPFGSSVRQAIETVDPDLPIWLGPFTLEQRLAGMGNYWNTANDALVLFVFAATALLLASFGLYAVIAHSVSQRTQEIGIRMALGAERGAVRRMVLGRGMLLMTIGIVLGLAGAAGLARYLSGMLYDVTPLDPATYAAVAALFAAAALLASYLPARRATQVDPVVALRCE
jgi:putative ABC transport system permease protein